MRLTQGADYGIRAMVYLARRPLGSVSLVQEIAGAQEIPPNYLAKICQELARSGLVQSHRGAKGGFSLARPAAEITLRQAIEAIEGPIALSDCLNASRGCDRVASCRLHPFLRGVQEQLMRSLDGITLRDLADGQDESLPFAV